MGATKFIIFAICRLMSLLAAVACSPLMASLKLTCLTRDITPLLSKKKRLFSVGMFFIKIILLIKKFKTEKDTE